VINGGIPLGRLFGISIRLHFSWFIIFILVTWLLAANYFPGTYSGWSTATSIIAAIITSLLFFSSVLAHELMHSIVARASGIPVKGITLFIFGGVSQITEEPRVPKVEFRVAIAGPATSLLLGLIFGAIFFTVPERFEAVRAITFWLSLINMMLAIFNLLPGFPLDGGRVLRSILWWRTGNLRKATKWASTAGRVIGFLFIFAGIWLVVTGFLFNGLWLAFIGWFLSNAAASSYRQLVIQQMLQGHDASEIMTQDCVMVAPDTTVEKLVNEYVLPSGNRCLTVGEAGHVQGLVTLKDIRSMPRDKWSGVRVTEVMTPIDKLKWVPTDETLDKVLNTLTLQDINQLPVVEGGRIVGMIARDNLLSFISMREKLGI
jgi:Zn-dependent protease